MWDDPFRKIAVRRICAPLFTAQTAEQRQALVAEWLSSGLLTRAELVAGIELGAENTSHADVDRVRHEALGAPREPSRVYRLPHEPYPRTMNGHRALVFSYERRLEEGDPEIVKREAVYHAAVKAYEQALAEWRRNFLAC
jgi:hypothetical protein